MTQLQPRPFDEGSVSFQGEVVACWAYEHTPPLSQSAPQTWLTFLRQKYRTLFEKLICSERPHAVIPIHITQDDFEAQAHILSIIHALTLINEKPTFAPHTFSVTFLIPNQLASQSFYQNICHWSKVFTAHKDDYTLTPPSLLLQLQHNQATTFQPILYPFECTPPSGNPLQLNLQFQSALFHILWTASNSSINNEEAAHLFRIAKHIADWTDNLVDDLLSIPCPKFLPRTFAVL